MKNNGSLLRNARNVWESRYWLVTTSDHRQHVPAIWAKLPIFANLCRRICQEGQSCSCSGQVNRQGQRIDCHFGVLASDVQVTSVGRTFLDRLEDNKTDKVSRIPQPAWQDWWQLADSLWIFALPGRYLAKIWGPLHYTPRRWAESAALHQQYRQRHQPRRD